MYPLAPKESRALLIPLAHLVNGAQHVVAAVQGVVEAARDGEVRNLSDHLARKASKRLHARIKRQRERENLLNQRECL